MQKIVSVVKREEGVTPYQTFRLWREGRAASFHLPLLVRRLVEILLELSLRLNEEVCDSNGCRSIFFCSMIRI